MSQRPITLALQEFPALLRRLSRELDEERGTGGRSNAAAVRPRVYVAGSAGEPSAMIATLSSEPQAAAGLHFVQFPLPDLNQMDFTALDVDTEQTIFFMTAALRNAAADRLHFVSIHMRRVYDYLLENPVAIALLQVARDADGELRIALNADFVEAALANPATLVVAQLNEGFVAPRGAPLARRIDYLLTGTSDAPEYIGTASAKEDRVAQQIGEYVASLIRNGDCLQTGIGAIPGAVLAALGDKRDLGFHGGLIDDGVLELIEQGVITGARKTLDVGQHVAGMALGSTGFIDRLGARDDVLLVGANRTHDAAEIARLDNFVSINSAVQVDLLGQINGEFAGGRQISGTGGSVDFMRSARGSRGGRSIVALPSTARGGSVSRIVPRVDMVTALRSDVDIVVTEHGIAHLRDLPMPERARRLRAVAAPEFRTELQTHEMT